MFLNCMDFDRSRQKSDQAHLNDMAEMINLPPGGGGGQEDGIGRVIG